MQQFKQGS